MTKNLVIVESPSKAKTISKFLGKNYTVIASCGHVRDLPKSQMGIDADNDFEPRYITIRGKGPILAQLRSEVKKADKVYLATDPDREGEAISWHLFNSLKLDEKKAKRITFNEITKNAVTNAIKNARSIDMDLVDAQQARRLLDRLVGYRISPLLWKKIKSGLSAGRVQSAALRLICEREKKINDFIPEEYWTLTGTFNLEQEKRSLNAEFYGKVGDKSKIKINNEKELDEIIKSLKKSSFAISDIKKSTKMYKSPLPFTTSTLQQEASKTINFSTQKTMRIAQSLYEGVNVKSRGTIGLITYLRTDSTRISDEAKNSASEFIEKTYGKEYLIENSLNEKKSEKKKNDNKIQDAHEAIRPTYVDLTPEMVKESLSRDEFKLYQLIWKRFAASQMAYAEYENTTVYIDNSEYRFTAGDSNVIFPGFMSVYRQEEDAQEKTSLPKKINKDSKLKADEFEKKQHFTQPLGHFTEASLVKELEVRGIGRPSTYAPTITTIINRRYVAKEKKNLYVTELGEIVDEVMEKYFSGIVNVEFTANMEILLDDVENGNMQWKDIIRNNYPYLDEAVINAEKELEHIEIKDEVTDEICDECGRNLVIKYGKYGKFLACPGFPDCHFTKPYFEKTGVKCPKCGKNEIVVKITKKGRRYYGCNDFPNCDFMSWQKPSDIKCPECGGVLLEKGKKLVCMNEQCGYVTMMENKEENN